MVMALKYLAVKLAFFVVAALLFHPLWGGILTFWWITLDFSFALGKTPIESQVKRLEAELKLARGEVATLLEDKKIWREIAEQYRAYNGQLTAKLLDQSRGEKGKVN